MTANATPVSDDEFLSSYCEALRIINSGTPRLINGVKDLHSAYLYCSDEFATAINVPIAKIMGSIDVLSTISGYLQCSIDEDQDVIKSRKLRRYVKINKFYNITKPMVFTKSPIINPATNNVIGIYFQAYEYATVHLFDQQINNLYSIFDKSEKTLTRNSLPDIHLTKRERQVIFFFLANLTSQEIADTLYQLDKKRVTKSTIDSVFTDHLYIKFDVNSRVALHGKLLSLGYDKLIPHEVLMTQSIPVEPVKIY